MRLGGATVVYQQTGDFRPFFSGAIGAVAGKATPEVTSSFFEDLADFGVDEVLGPDSGGSCPVPGAGG